MDDKTMLELAAKAAGYDVRWHENWQCFVHVGPHNITNPPTMAGQRMVWVPLTDDGDALRLAVKLKLSVEHMAMEVIVTSLTGDVLLEPNDDPYAATRRAIVRAAAAIGAKSEVNDVKDQ